LETHPIVQSISHLAMMALLTGLMVFAVHVQAIILQPHDTLDADGLWICDYALDMIAQDPKITANQMITYCRSIYPQAACDSAQSVLLRSGPDKVNLTEVCGNTNTSSGLAGKMLLRRRQQSLDRPHGRMEGAILHKKFSWERGTSKRGSSSIDQQAQQMMEQTFMSDAANNTFMEARAAAIENSTTDVQDATIAADNATTPMGNATAQALDTAAKSPPTGLLRDVLQAAAQRIGLSR